MKKKLSGLDKSLIFVAIIVVLFTISMIATFWFKGDVPNVLITAVFGATFAECGFCSYIWKQKVTNDSSKQSETKCKISKEKEKEEEINEYGDGTNDKNDTGNSDNNIYSYTVTRIEEVPTEQTGE